MNFNKRKILIFSVARADSAKQRDKIAADVCRMDDIYLIRRVSLCCSIDMYILYIIIYVIIDTYNIHTYAFAQTLA